LSEYLAEILNTTYVYNQSKNLTKTGTVSNLHLVEIKKLKIPLPNLHTQKQILSEIKYQKKLIESNKQLSDIFEKKVSDMIDGIWSK